MSFICMWRLWLWSLLGQFWISSCFSLSFKAHSAVKSTLTKLYTLGYKRILRFNQVFSGVVVLDVVFGTVQSRTACVGGLPFSSPLADRCCCIWVAGAGTCTHCPPPPPLAWYDLNWCPAGAFFPRTPQTGWSGGGVAVRWAFSSSPIKIKSPVVWRGPLGSWL